DPAALELRRMVLDAKPYDLADVHALPLHVDPAFRYSGDIQKVVDEPDHVPALPFDDLARLLGFGAAGARPPQREHTVHDRAKRVAQLVRENREKLVLSLVSIRQQT